MFSEIWKKT